ncbi:metallophosphoesterase [Allosphingosinicella indica]|uniref:metallophosphoesterase n=1 Tax=Allosphingosinicella indica TaxID=941907 RepID=UPI001FCDBCCB|nr:metallophosphoesterase [Allosphingosinicella indica]
MENDLARRPVPRAFIVFLGDLIDRGPQSCEVIDRLANFSHPYAKCVVLMGNHEEILLRVMAAEPGLLTDWMRFGGAECVASYGVDPAGLSRLDEKAGAALLRQHIPARHLAFLESFGDTFKFGDYLFVHAGIRPGVAMEDQVQRDLRWIRGPFLDDVKTHGCLVVHGHTIVEAVEERSNRIAIDTGAVYSGVLTALVVEGAERHYLATGPQKQDEMPPAASGSENASLLRVAVSL